MGIVHYEVYYLLKEVRNTFKSILGVTCKSVKGEYIILPKVAMMVD